MPGSGPLVSWSVVGVAWDGPFLGFGSGGFCSELASSQSARLIVEVAIRVDCRIRSR